MSASDAVAALDTVASFPLHTHALGDLAPGALSLAVGTGLSAYDCCYAVLDELLDIPIVTADRRLAAASPRAELVT